MLPIINFSSAGAVAHTARGTAAVAALARMPAATGALVGGAAAARALSASGGAEVAQKRAAVVGAVRHAWMGYEAYAWGADELKPVSRSRTDWIGLGLTILDSLDVLWLAGLKKEFNHGMEWVRASLDFNKPRMVSFFETTIRCLGGLCAPPAWEGGPLPMARRL